MPGIEFTHSYKAQVREIWPPVGISPGQTLQVFQLTGTIERDLNYFVPHHVQHGFGRAQVKCSLRKDCFARQNRPFDSFRQLPSPLVMPVIRS